MVVMANKALVTGGAGFIGSNLISRLLKSGWVVDVADDLSNGHIGFVPKQILDDNLWINDFSSPHVLQMIRDKKFDYVFHLAAEPRVTFSLENPSDTHEVNVGKTLRLIEACVGNVKRFVFTSSAAVYGDAEELPTPETARLYPASPYGLQKASVEDYLKIYGKHHGLDSVCLRLFNVFGPNQLGGSPYSTVISAWLEAINTHKSLRVDGDGEQRRDMCYVDNVTHALVLSALKKEDFRGEVFNVAGGESISNNQVLGFLRGEYPRLETVSAPHRPGDIRLSWALLEKSKNVLGYEPITNFWLGLRKTIEWNKAYYEAQER